MLKNHGVTTYGNSQQVYQLTWEQNGKLVHYGNAADVKSNYTKALACIDRHLKDNRPIIIGVNHSLKQGRNEGATDHFMLITGKGYDAVKGQYYYTYTDPGRSMAVNGCDTKENRLYYDSGTNEFYDLEAGSKNSRFDVTQVRPNDGKYLSETIAQPKV